MSSLFESHVAVHLRCFLCDHELPEIDGEPPRYPVVSLFDYGRIDASPWNSAQVAKLMGDTGANYMVPSGWKRFMRHHTNPGVLFTDASICVGCGYCQPENSLFIAHRACWRITQGNGISPSRLYGTALRTTPLAPERRGHHFPLSISSLAGAVKCKTSLGGLITDMADRLPEELVREIMNEVQLHAMSFERYGKMNETEYKALLKDSGVLFTRLATVQTLALPMAKHGFEDAWRNVEGKDCEKLETMHIRTVQIFGRDYISKVGFNETADDLMSIPVVSEDIRGLRFALGRFGLRGLRILYADGTMSSWLGSTLGCWFGNAEGRSLRDLEVFADGPRIVGIKLRPPTSPKRHVYHALLDLEIESSHGERLAFIFKPDDRRPFFSTPHYPARTWKHVYCLPLAFGSTYTSGLTMFWSKGTLKGMASYGPNNEVATVGLCKGEAVHFPLAPGEYFTSLWIRMGYVQPPLVEPFLLTLGTSAGRSAHFGPQILLRPWRSSAMLQYGWEAISSWTGPTKITGLLVEALGESQDGGHRSFGVFQEPLDSSNDEWWLTRPTVLGIDVKSPDPGEHFDYQETFRSTGSLNDVKGIQIRHKADRCVGMRIVHDTGLDDFLGSWDPADVSSISTVYDSAREAVLRTLLFHVRFKEEDLKPIIFGVTTGNSADSYVERLGGRDIMLPISKVIPVEETALVSDTSLPDDFLVEFQCGHPEKMIAWYHDERTTEARSFTPLRETGIGRNFHPDGLCALVWEPLVPRNEGGLTEGRFSRS